MSRIVKQSQAETRGKDADQRAIQNPLRDQSLLKRIHQIVFVLRAAGHIGPRDQRHRRRLLHIFRVIMPGQLLAAHTGKHLILVAVRNRAAVGNHKPVKSPLLAQQRCQQHIAAGGRYAVNTVVGGHD